MPTVLDRLPNGAHVVVVRLRSLGDCVLTTPAIHLLKSFRPDLRIAVVVEPRFAAVFEGNPDVEALVGPTVGAVRQFNPQLCLNLHGGTTSARLTLLSGARYRAGFGHYALPFVYNVRIPRAQEILGEERPVHTAEHVASATFWLGVPRQEIPRARLFAEPELRESPYAVIHPFASQEAKTWPARFFLQLAQHLKRQLDVQPIFISGPGEDLSTFQMWPTVGNPPLQRTKELLAGAAAFVGNDSGPAHMAAAFGIPTLVFFGASDPVTWAPWRTSSEVLISDGPLYSIPPATGDRRIRETVQGGSRVKDWLRLLSYARRYWLLLLGSVVLMAIVGAAQACIPLLLGPVIDKVLRPDAVDEQVALFQLPFLEHPIYLNSFMPFHIHRLMTMVGIAVMLVFFLKGVCDYAANYLISYCGFSAVTDLRNAVFEKVLRQGAEFFESNSTGRLMSSVMNDIEKIQTATSNMLADLLRQTFSVLALLVVVTQTNWRLALVSLTVLPIVLVPTARIGRRIRNTSRRTQEHLGELSQILQETISGHAVVHAFNAEKYELSRFRASAKRLLRSNLRYVLQQALASPLIEICGALTIVGLLWYARVEIKNSDLTAGKFMGFIVALLMMYEPVKRLTGIHNIFQQAIGAAQKVFEYLDRDEDIQEKPKAPKLERFVKSIQFEDVAFQYPTAEGYQLQSIDLEVKAGEVVALVGPSGAGKSTLANLVPRFYDVVSGKILIDGKDIRDFTIESLRGKIGLVAQDTFLFNDTVARNIAYGRSDVPIEEIKDAARNALAHEFIDALPNGYETSIGERGVRLSGGQRQRLAIARAMLKNAPILILDEATSHLDTESELLVQKALANLMVNRTVIVIAHRISTIRRADKIVVIDRGQIAETGTHDELVNGKGIYQRLHELQFMTAGVNE